MAKFTVTLVRTVTTVIEVEAASAQATRAEIENYGPLEAARDYTNQDASDVSRVKSVKRSAP